MRYLIITILLNTLLFALFKLFPRYRVDSLQAIVFNYITCVVTGSVLLGRFPVNATTATEPWFCWALLMGAMFISLFNLIAWRTREDGMTTTTIANKLSLVIPVLFSVWLYQEQVNALKIAGILLAFPAVYLTTRVKKDEAAPRSLLFPALLFLGSGLLDTLVKYVEHHFLTEAAEQAAYTVVVFAAASVLGTAFLLFLWARGKLRFQLRNVLAGIVLGIPNYFSIYYLIQLLHSDFLQSSAAIPVNNIGIVLLSALAAILFFKEPISRQRIAGLLLSIAAILMIALSDYYGTTA